MKKIVKCYYILLFNILSIQQILCVNSVCEPAVDIHRFNHGVFEIIRNMTNVVQQLMTSQNATMCQSICDISSLTDKVNSVINSLVVIKGQLASQQESSPLFSAKLQQLPIFKLPQLQELQLLPKSSQNQITDLCMRCICNAISGCNEPSTQGLFRITYPYWVDSGRPVQQGDFLYLPNAYDRCIIDADCSARSVRGYMHKFGQDCNGDGKLDCLDYAAIHIHGGYGCKTPLPHTYGEEIDKCLKNNN